MSGIVSWFIDMLYAVERPSNSSKPHGKWVVTDIYVNVKVNAYNGRAPERTELLKDCR